MKSGKGVWLTVLVASMGYFVDIFDLQLFNIVSKDSLRGIGITDPEVIARYDYILFLWQMAGMLVGGILWGVLGDRKGRKSILFGSIIMYSVANIANAFVVDLEQYSMVRFIAGLGLAGELGAAITLVSEIMHKEKRGYGTMAIVTMGALGAVAAVQLRKANFEIAGLANWQVMYIIGGVLGLMLLALRMGTFESGMFDEIKKKQVSKGNFFILFNNRRRFLKYLACILIGLPVWYTIGVLVKFSEKIAADIGVIGGQVSVGDCIMYAYVGLSAGDLLSGLLSQMFRSRKKIVMFYLIACAAVVAAFLFMHGMNVSTFYMFCFLLGTASGYWALFVTMASEQFGTNIRATVTTTVPNFVRGANLPIIWTFVALAGTWGNIGSALIVGGICIGLAIIALISLPETFGKDLDYAEIS
ncbi:MAG: hypothetical protein RL220_937 [Bacteroidota bacterium]